MFIGKGCFWKGGFLHSKSKTQIGIWALFHGSKFRKISGGFVAHRGATKPPQMEAARKMRRVPLSQISVGVCSSALPRALDGFLEQVLRESASPSCCSTFPSDFAPPLKFGLI